MEIWSGNINIPLNVKSLRVYERRVISVFSDTKAGSGYCRYSRSLTKLVTSPPQALRCDLFLICNHHAATTDRYPLYHPTGTLHGLCAYLLPFPNPCFLAHAYRRMHTNCHGFGYHAPMRRLGGSVRNICFGINFSIVCRYARFDKHIQRRGQPGE